MKIVGRKEKKPADRAKQAAKLQTRKKQQLHRKLLHVFFSLLLLAAFVFVGYKWAYPYYQKWEQHQEMLRSRPKVQLAGDGTSTSAAWHNLDAYHEGLKQRYGFVYRAAYETPAQTTVGVDYVIPGLAETPAYDYVKKRVTTADAMTPQGIAIAYNYMLITAYDANHTHASVIYVLDKNTGKYLKTIHLPGRPHVGGIAYDPKGMQIWITGSKDDQSALMSFSLAKLIEYVTTNKSAGEAIKYDVDIPITSIVKASTLAYYDDQLFVGYFNEDGHGKVASYKIARSGKYKNTITTSEITSVNDSVAWSDPDGSTSMNKQIQGLAIYGNKIFLSQSYGSKDSRLYIFPVTAIKNLDEKNAEQVVTMPPYLEQIIAYNGQLICLFESGSAEYATPRITVMDRTLSVNINALLDNN